MGVLQRVVSSSESLLKALTVGASVEHRSDAKWCKFGIYYSATAVRTLATTTCSWLAAGSSSRVEVVRGV